MTIKFYKTIAILLSVVVINANCFSIYRNTNKRLQSVVEMSLEEPSSSLSSSTEISKFFFLLLISSGLNFVIMNKNLEPLVNTVNNIGKNQVELANKQSELDLKISAAGFGLAGSLALFAGAGNIVKILEYWDKKSDTQK